MTYVSKHLSEGEKVLRRVYSIDDLKTLLSYYMYNVTSLFLGIQTNSGFNKVLPNLNLANSLLKED